MHFTKPVAIFISREFTSPVVDTLMVVAPCLQTGINALLVRINKCSWNDSVFNERFDRLLLDIGKQIDHHLPTALHHAKDRRFFLLHRASTGFAFASAATA